VIQPQNPGKCYLLQHAVQFTELEKAYSRLMQFEVFDCCETATLPVNTPNWIHSPESLTIKCEQTQTSDLSMLSFKWSEGNWGEKMQNGETNK
jgi:hypothetical protein